MKSPTPAPVFIPPGAGSRRLPRSPAARRAGAPAMVGGWRLAKAVAALVWILGLAAGAYYIIDSSRPTAAPPSEFLKALLAAVPGALLLPVYYALAALGALYNLAWIILPLVALCQGDLKGALRYFVLSPLLIGAAAVLGSAAGAAITVIYLRI